MKCCWFWQHVWDDDVLPGPSPTPPVGFVVSTFAPMLSLLLEPSPGPLSPGSDRLPCTVAGGYYCVPSSSTDTPTLCPPGSFCRGGNNPRAPCTVAPSYLCVAGLTSQAATLCPAGFYCPGAASPSIPCSVPAGTYCAAGLSVSVATTCPAGWFCAGECGYTGRLGWQEVKSHFFFLYPALVCFALLSSHFQVKPTHSLHTTTLRLVSSACAPRSFGGQSSVHRARWYVLPHGLKRKHACPVP